VVVGLAVCEQVIVEEGTRNITLVNCFTRLRVGELPSAGRLANFAMLTDGLGDGTVSVVVENLENLEEVFAQQNPIRFSDSLQEVRILFRLSRLSFPVAGRYQITLFVDSDPVAHRVIAVLTTEDDHE
jgi:hypothetical protein